MSKISTFYKRTGPVSVILSVIFSVLFVVTVVQAATTIGTNISTDGTVSVAGLSTFGNASSTQFSVFNNAYFGATATSTFSSTGALTLAGALTLTTASSTGLATLDSVKVSSVGDTVADIQHGTCTVTIGSITASTTAMTTCTATGVTTSHKVFVTPYITNNGIFMVSASSTADNTIQIAVHNVGYTGAVNPADNLWSWMAVR
ncbi:MAG: hypothetical protein AAB523_00280 [Patescibacteria group bacterium]